MRNVYSLIHLDDIYKIDGGAHGKVKEVIC
jgi:hypothetical protein